MNSVFVFLIVENTKRAKQFVTYKIKKERGDGFG